MKSGLIGVAGASLALSGMAAVGAIDWSAAESPSPGVRVARVSVGEPRLLKAHVARVDLRDGGFAFRATERDPDWGKPMPDCANGVIRTRRQTTCDFLADARRSGADMVLAFNSALWEPFDPKVEHVFGEPLGYNVSGGRLVSDREMPVKFPVFYVDREGEPHILDANRPPLPPEELTLCHAGLAVFLRNGREIAFDGKDWSAGDKRDTRMAYGLSGDGRYFFAVATDGRQPGWSDGADRKDLAEVMLAAGAADAIEMDGGGSTSLVYWDGAGKRPVLANRHDAARKYMRRTALNIGIVATGRKPSRDVIAFSESGDAVRFGVAGGKWTRKGTWIARGKDCVQPVCGVMCGGVAYVVDRVRSGAESEGRILKYAKDGRFLGAFQPKLDFFPSALAVSPDGEWLYAVCGFDRHRDSLWRWRISDGRGGRLPVPELETARAMAFGGDGLLYAACRGMSAVRAFDVSGGDARFKGALLSRGASTGGLVMDAARARMLLPGAGCEIVDLRTGKRAPRPQRGMTNAFGGTTLDGRFFVTDRAHGTVRAETAAGAFDTVAEGVADVMGLMPLRPDRVVLGRDSYAHDVLFRPAEDDFRPMPYCNPKARPPLKGGLCPWALPFDVNGDGRLDIVLQSWHVAPYAGIFVCENLGGRGGDALFAAPRRIRPYGGDGMSVSFWNGRAYVTTPSGFAPDFPKGMPDGFRAWRDLPWNVHWEQNVNRNNRRLADLDGDGRLDLIVGVGDAREYGWGNFYEPRGNYKNARPHGYIYWIRNLGTGTGLPGGEGEERWDEPKLLRLRNRFPVETLGSAFPMPHDWDGDGDLDLLCADASGTVSYFENVGTRRRPVFEGETFVLDSRGRQFEPFLNQMTANAVDWDGDGRMDFVFCEESGQVGFARNTGRLDSHRAPVFEPPVYFRQQAENLNLSSLSTPCAFDWDGDGDLDLICGEAGGRIAFIENLSGPGVDVPSWAEPRYLSCAPATANPIVRDAYAPFDFETFRNDPITIRAGANGSILGPVEALYGYTAPSVADWNGDGLPDIMANSIWGKPLLFLNVGTRAEPRLAAPVGVEVEWEGGQPSVPWGWFHPDREANPKELITQWRTTPCMVDLDGDGLVDLVMMDHEGAFAFFRRARGRDGKFVLRAPERLICDENGVPINMSWGHFGASGRRKICFCDWTGDGTLDLITDGPNATLHRGLGRGKDGKWRFRNEGPMGLLRLEGHTTSPTPADFDGDGVPDLVVGAEDGFFYRLNNPRSAKTKKQGKAN